MLIKKEAILLKIRIKVYNIIGFYINLSNQYHYLNQLNCKRGFFLRFEACQLRMS